MLSRLSRTKIRSVFRDPAPDSPNSACCPTYLRVSVHTGTSKEHPQLSAVCHRLHTRSPRKRGLKWVGAAQARTALPALLWASVSPPGKSEDLKPGSEESPSALGPGVLGDHVLGGILVTGRCLLSATCRQQGGVPWAAAASDAHPVERRRLRPAGPRGPGPCTPRSPPSQWSG